MLVVFSSHSFRLAWGVRVGKQRLESKAQEVIPMRKLIAAATMSAMMVALTAAPAAAQTTQEGLVNLGNVGIGANVCDVNVLVENDAAAEDQCTNTQNN